MPYTFRRRYRLCSVLPREWTYRIFGSFPKKSLSEAFVELRDTLDNAVRHDAETGIDLNRTMQAFDVSQEFSLPAGDIDLDLELVVPDDASSQAGWAHFELLGHEVRRQDTLNAFPAECFSTPPPPRLDVETWDIMGLDSLYHAARVIEQCYLNIETAQTVAGELALEGDIIKGIAVDNRPGSGVVVLRSPGRVLVWIAGTTSSAQLIRQGKEALKGAKPEGPYSTSPIWREGAGLVLQALTLAQVAGSQPIVLMGHSMGGAIACVVGRILGLEIPARSIQVLTFGCPKPGDRRLADWLETKKTRHIVNDGDVVPFVCPDLSKSTGWFPNPIPADIRTATATWKSPPSRVALYADGTLRDNGAVESLDKLVLQAIQDWLDEQPIRPGEAHAMATYRRRLGLAVGIDEEED